MARWRQLHLHPGGGLVELGEAQDAGGIVRVGAAGALSGAGALSAAEWVEGGEEFLRVGDAVAVAVQQHRVLSGEDRLETRLREMMVACQRFSDAFLPHHYKGHAIC